jgi:S-DNA-T family DNA segregation ATPase FtsK/SpoIIIE
MHLIIGTQRPSVDVITGLIKANFPSRISFRVSQLVDSRTIIDRAGAESLVGRGDMLYSPVGSHEPMRVQGSFVSDEEVERVVEFIKLNNGSAEYNSGAIAEVERNAASIGSGSKKGGSVEGEDEEAFEDDPMLRPAIELAVEQGKISTSLIQRRLSLGYGRAAKLIDRMEQLGYVSAPEGQKPRDVLITKEQFMEMVLRDTDS